jgi:phosphoenolpyruvate synthase/pyruvate phosphate dikinase
MKFSSTFSELSKNDSGIAGGKGASLGEMMNAAIPVPVGFVVLSTTFDYFLHETDLTQEIEAVLKTVDHKAIHIVDAASEKIRGLIEHQEIPENIASEIKSEFKKLDTEYVAVRSSATAEDGAEHAWAGQLDSFLNTTEEDLLENVKKCWSSLFTPRAIFYRFEKDLHGTQISVAVVIQKMVQSEVSGIAFSVHPVTEDYNQLIIEAGFGLGEAIVSGSITPDSYVVEKNPINILDVNISDQKRGLFKSTGGVNEWKDINASEGAKQKLSAEQILELSKIIINIENHYGFPCDIEWAFEGGKFYIVQSRPITTLNTKVLVEEKSNLNPDDYVRMFAGSVFVYLFSDLFLQYYGDLGVLSVQDSNYWTSLLPISVKEKTLEDGKILYTSKEKYSQYKKEFDEYLNYSAQYFESILKKENLSDHEVETFMQLASKHWFFYSKTEFFYTDYVQPNELAISVSEFDKLKLDGRKHLNKIVFEPDGYMGRFLKKLEAQTNVSVDHLKRYSVREVIDLVKNKTHVEDEIIKDRDIFFSSKDLNIIGKEAKPLAEKFVNKYRQVSNLIKGVIANKGIARGKARVLVVDFGNFNLVSNAVKEMQEGEILVAETTAPEIIQACHKAAAIITNQGGMLSHAAIISRELNIPCIIGTDKDVILSIKTGDDVEVDADNGIIRILK